MTGVGCLVEIRLVAIDAILVKPREDIVQMAACTGNCLMRTHERKFRAGMAESRRCPHGRGVALVACVCKISRQVIGACGLVKVGLMTLEAVHVHKLIISSNVAALALLCCMLPGEGELGGRVVECRRAPAVH